MAKKQIRGLNLDQFQLLLFKIMNRRTVVMKVQLKFWSWVMTHLHYGRSEPRHHRKIKSCERMNSKCTVKLSSSLVDDLLSVDNVLKSVQRLNPTK